MCLLIHHRPDSEMEPEFIADVFRKNSDGFGVMFGTGEAVRVHKRLPKDPEELVRYYNKRIKGRECVIHFRMRTHGEIDLKNAHPYRVTDDLWMAHNGVLGTIGNSVNPKMSDTWHLIHLYLKPMLADNPDLIFKPSFQRMLGGFIGTSNKLGFVHKTGKVVLINESAGVEHKNMWLSNTYAWSYGRTTGYGGYGNRGGWYSEGGYGYAAAASGNYQQYYGSKYGHNGSASKGTTTTAAPAVPKSNVVALPALPAPAKGAEMSDADDLRAIGEALRRGDQESLVRRFLEGKGAVSLPAETGSKSAKESAEVFESAYENVGGEVVAVDDAVERAERAAYGGQPVLGPYEDEDDIGDESLMTHLGWV